MKYILLLFFQLLYFSPHAQNVDSLISQIFEGKTDSSRIMRLRLITEIKGRKDRVENMVIHQKILDESRKRGDKVIETYITAELGFYIDAGGDKPTGTRMVFDALKMAEELGNRQVIGVAYINLGHMYATVDQNKSMEYYRKGMTESQAVRNMDFVTPALLYIGKMYLNQNKLDSARYYLQRAYEVALSSKSEVMPAFILPRLSRLYYQSGNKLSALGFLYEAMETSSFKNDRQARGEIFIALAKFYYQEKRFDSSLYYAMKSWETLKDDIYVNRFIPTEFLKDFYKGRNADSALKYTELYYQLVDSITRDEKLLKVHMLSMQEEARQSELEKEKLQSDEARRHNIQYLGILVGLVTLIIGFILLSNTIIIGRKTIKFLGVLALLIMFEFINLLIHPWLDKITNHSPVLMLIALVTIGALLVPLHHKIEKWVLVKMTDKNRKIQVAKAKKILAELDNDSTTPGQ